MTKTILQILDEKKYTELTGKKRRKIENFVSVDDIIASKLIQEGCAKLTDAETFRLEEIERKKKQLHEKKEALQESAKKSNIQIDEWEKAKKDYRINWNVGDEISFPVCENFEEDIFINQSQTEAKPYPLAYTYEKIDKDGDTIHSINFFGETLPSRARITHTLSKDFFEYLAKGGRRNYILFSLEPIEETHVRVWGTKINLVDTKKIGEKASVPTSKTIIIVSKTGKPKVAVEEIKTAIIEMKGKDFIENYFGIFRQPPIFEKLIIIFNIASAYEYPLHILAGDIKFEDKTQGSTGKSDLLDRIYRINRLPYKPFAGDSGRPKGLIPSFATATTKPGYLLSTDFIAGVDEFFSLYESATKNQIERENFEKAFNGLYESHDRLAESGNTEPTILRPRFRSILLGNMPRGNTGLSDLLNNFDNPFLERNIPYLYTAEHLEFISKNRVKVDNVKRLKGVVGFEVSHYLRFASKIPLRDDTPEFVELLRVLWESILDMKDKDGIKPLLSEAYRTYFEKRGYHHVRCVLDGLVKLHHLPEFNAHVLKCLEADEYLPWEYIPTSEDLQEIIAIFRMIFRSWSGFQMNMKLNSEAV